MATAKETTNTVAKTASVDELLRLAWLADAEGRPRLRDAMMTLAVAECGPGDAVLAERCRRLLVARHPTHWYATTATLGQALTHEKVAGALVKLRTMFPPVRVQRILLRGAVQRGPFTGRTRSLSSVLEDLGLTPERAATRRDEERTRARSQALLFPAPGLEPDAALEPPPLDTAGVDDSLAPLYLAVLLAMAVLISTVIDQRPALPDSGTRAA